MSGDPKQRRRGKRAAARRAAAVQVPLRKFRLDEEPIIDDRWETSIEARLAQLARLSRRAYQLSGRPFPHYERENIPGVVIRGTGHERKRME